jgi:hypothetical protein
MQSMALSLQADACFENIRELDDALARTAQKSGSLRFALGVGLDALARSGGHAELGFTSIDDYGQERCERGATWIRQSRQLARRVSELPCLRRALISGRISWSMAAQLVRSATLENEGHLLQLAASSTVARMKELLVAPSDDAFVEPDSDPLCTLTLTENHEDALLFECAQRLARHVGATTMSDVVDALIGEATTSLMPLIPKDAADPNDLAPSLDAQNAYIRQRNQWRDEAERLCEPRIPAWSGVEVGFNDLPDFTGDPAAIDAALRRASAALQERDLVIGELAERFWNADGWRRLGYASARQYSRERLGMSLSSVKDKRQLARKFRELPYLARAFHEHVVGYEAARLVARIATPETDEAWTDHAAHRTLVHLREDLRAAGLLARVSRRENPAPPPDDVVADLKALEARVITGAVFQDGGQKSASETGAAIETAFHAARHCPAPLRSLGRDTLRLRVEPEIRAAYRGLERLFERHRPVGMTFLRFACQSLIDTHAHELPKIAYAHIYARDGLRCTNPFCTRRDCTPHHVRFRSHGGDDSDDNVITLCTRCHLDGVHRGRFTVTRIDKSLVWRFGAHTIVVDRTRYRAAA